MPTVLLAGEVGRADPGDQAVLDAFVAALPDHRVLVLGPDPATGEVRGAPALSLADPATLRRGMRQVDAVVAGGLLFQSHPPERPGKGVLRNLAALAALSAPGAKPLAMVGVSAGDLAAPTDRWLARRLVHRADLLVLADHESSEILTRAGAPSPLRVGADPAWASIGLPATARSGSDLVMVVLDAGAGPALEELLVAALTPLVRAGLRVRLQPWSSAPPPSSAPPSGSVPSPSSSPPSRSVPSPSAAPGPVTTSDVQLARSLAAALGSRAEVVPAPMDLAQARDLYAQAAVVVAVPYRALHAAAAAGVPCVALTQETRMAGLARRLVQAVVGLDGPPPELIRTIAKARAGEPASPSRVGEEVARAEAGFQLLRLVLAKGRSEEPLDATRLPLGPESWLR